MTYYECQKIYEDVYVPLEEDWTFNAGSLIPDYFEVAESHKTCEQGGHASLDADECKAARIQ